MKELDWEMWKCGKKGKDAGCAQGCDTEYGTYHCWECPDPNGPSHKMIRTYMEERKKKRDLEEPWPADALQSLRHEAKQVNHRVKFDFQGQPIREGTKK